MCFSLQSGLLPSGYKTQEGLSLELESVRRQDAGTYLCTADNGVGQEASAEIQVEIKCKCTKFLAFANLSRHGRVPNS